MASSLGGTSATRTKHMEKWDVKTNSWKKGIGWLLDEKRVEHQLHFEHGTSIVPDCTVFVSQSTVPQQVPPASTSAKPSEASLRAIREVRAPLASRCSNLGLRTLNSALGVFAKRPLLWKKASGSRERDKSERIAEVALLLFGGRGV